VRRPRHQHQMTEVGCSRRGRGQGHVRKDVRVDDQERSVAEERQRAEYAPTRFENIVARDPTRPFPRPGPRASRG
jgi:hypothetical protein